MAEPEPELPMIGHATTEPEYPVVAVPLDEVVVAAAPDPLELAGLELARPETDPPETELPETEAPAGTPWGTTVPGRGGFAMGSGTIDGARSIVARTLPSAASSRSVPRTAQGPGLELATDRSIGAANETTPPTGAIESVAPPAKVTSARATEGPTLAATHQAGEPSSEPKVPVVIAGTSFEDTCVEAPAVLESPVEMPPAIAKDCPSKSPPWPTAAVSEKSSV
jgi:hypothetical protein